MMNKKWGINMNHKELKDYLNTDAVTNLIYTDETNKHFKKKYPQVLINGQQVFLCDTNREFNGKNHKIIIHKRGSDPVPLHIYQYVFLYYVYCGEIITTIDNRVYHLKAGDLVIFDRYVPHSVEKTMKDDLAINMILSDVFFENNSITISQKNNKQINRFLFELMNNHIQHPHYFIFNTKEDSFVRSCVDNILCEHFDNIMYSNEIIEHFIVILITHLVRKFPYQTNLVIDNTKNLNLVNEILIYIQHNYQNGNLNEMCKKLGFNPTYISRVVKENLGQNFKDLINTERMKKASILLINYSIPIYEVAEKVGFSNLNSFYKKFQEYAGCKPQEFRDRFNKKRN